MDDRPTSDSRSDPTGDSAWRFAATGGAISSPCYFDEESSILNEFGWSFPLETGRIGENSAGLAPPPCDHDDAASGSTALPAILPAAVVSPKSSARSGDAFSSSSSEEPEPPPEPEERPPGDTANKVTKKGQKRSRQPRVAFMTRSEIDHLEDGYRWRKYGQKAVKNSPFPRSYYRCTNSKCTVKKRVERSSDDPAIVITTYEGQHCHHTVAFPRGTIAHVHHNAAALAERLAMSTAAAVAPPQLYFPPTLRDLNQNRPMIASAMPIQLDQQVLHQQHPKAVPDIASSPRTAGEGLLGDIVPPAMRNG